MLRKWLALLLICVSQSCVPQCYRACRALSPLTHCAAVCGCSYQPEPPISLFAQPPDDEEDSAHPAFLHRHSQSASVATAADEDEEATVMHRAADSAQHLYSESSPSAEIPVFALVLLALTCYCVSETRRRKPVSPTLVDQRPLLVSSEFDF